MTHPFCDSIIQWASLILRLIRWVRKCIYIHIYTYIYIYTSIDCVTPSCQWRITYIFYHVYILCRKPHLFCDSFMEWDSWIRLIHRVTFSFTQTQPHSLSEPHPLREPNPLRKPHFFCNSFIEWDSWIRHIHCVTLLLGVTLWVGHD